MKSNINKYLSVQYVIGDKRYNVVHLNVTTSCCLPWLLLFLGNYDSLYSRPFCFQGSGLPCDFNSLMILELLIFNMLRFLLLL